METAAAKPGGDSGSEESGGGGGETFQGAGFLFPSENWACSCGMCHIGAHLSPTAYSVWESAEKNISRECSIKVGFVLSKFMSSSVPTAAMTDNKVSAMKPLRVCIPSRSGVSGYFCGGHVLLLLVGGRPEPSRFPAQTAYQSSSRLIGHFATPSRISGLRQFPLAEIVGSDTPYRVLSADIQRKVLFSLAFP